MSYVEKTTSDIEKTTSDIFSPTSTLCKTTTYKNITKSNQITVNQVIAKTCANATATPCRTTKKTAKTARHTKITSMVKLSRACAVKIMTVPNSVESPLITQ